MIKVILIYITLIFFININNSYSIENKILLKIENEIITNIDVQNESKYLLLLNPSIKNLSKKEIFNLSKKSLIREKIQNIELLNNFKELKVPDSYLEEILKNVYKKIGINNLDTFKKYLGNNNIDYDHVKNKIEIEALWNELIVSKFSSKVIINQEDIKKKLKNDNKFFTKNFLISEIFFETTNSDEVQVIYNKIKKTIENKGFETAALKYSLSSSANSGGKLGWIEEQTLNKDLKEIFLKMKEGDFTKPITIPGGFMILKIDKIKKVRKNQNIDIDLKNIVNKTRNNQLNQFSKMYFNKVKKDIQISEF